jgi:glycosyltransferase involved in cell wall biosynthesis
MPAPVVKLRIALPTGIFPPDIGGPASYVPRIAEALIERGHGVQVITLADNPADGGAYAFPVRRIRRGMSRLPRMLRTIADIARSARSADIIFANGLFIEAAIAAGLVRKPLVMKIVGDWAWERASNARIGDRDMADFQRRRQPVRFELVKFLRSVTTRRADRIIVASRFFADIVAGWGISPSALEVIPNTLDLSAESDAKAAEPLEPFKGHTLVTVGRLIPFKRVDALIRLLAERVDLRLVIVGDGPERCPLERLADGCGVKERTVFAGSVPHVRIAGFLRAGDALIVNSSNETFGYAVIEGFAAGVPVVACKGGSIPELVADGENGLLFSPDDRGGLSKAIDRLFADPGLREKIIVGGRRAYAERYRWEVLLVRTEEVLRKASRRNGGRR